MFKQFANTDETLDNVERVPERSQVRPAEWPKDYPSVKLTRDDITAPVHSWAWERVASMSDLMPSTEGVTSAAVKWGDTQLAIFDVPGRGLYATQQMCVLLRRLARLHPAQLLTGALLLLPLAGAPTSARRSSRTASSATTRRAASLSPARSTSASSRSRTASA